MTLTLSQINERFTMRECLKIQPVAGLLGMLSALELRPDQILQKLFRKGPGRHQFII